MLEAWISLAAKAAAYETIGLGSMAFSLASYTKMLLSLRSDGYRLGPVRAYFEGAESPFVFVRHDVDRLVFRAVRMAEAESELGIRATYYFRCDRQARFPGEQIRRIAELGHEIGFHYETVSRERGDVDGSYARFKRELEILRTIGEVKTVAAHGSPLARCSNMGCTEGFDLGELGLYGDSREDVDFHRVYYVTDTGGIFGSRHNLRDHVDGKQLQRPTSPASLPKRLATKTEPWVLLSAHPERWPESSVGLLGAKAFDAGVNIVKCLLRPLRQSSAPIPEERHRQPAPALHNECE